MIKIQTSNKSLNDLYKNNINIMQYLRTKNNMNCNNSDSILASYDMQAGSYVARLKLNKMNSNIHINSIKTNMTAKEYLKKVSDELSSEINKYQYNSILESGVGEATTFSYLVKKLKNKKCKQYGFDISPSRIQVANKFARENAAQAQFFTADMFHIPFQDNSFDIVYTVHALEPNTNNEKPLVLELLRVANKYLILVEPSYELGNKATKLNIDKHKYIKNLKNTVYNLAKDLDLTILKYELMPIGTYSNQPAIVVIKKNNPVKQYKKIKFACPICHELLDVPRGGGGGSIN